MTNKCGLEEEFNIKLIDILLANVFFLQGIQGKLLFNFKMFLRKSYIGTVFMHLHHFYPFFFPL